MMPRLAHRPICALTLLFVAFCASAPALGSEEAAEVRSGRELVARQLFELGRSVTEANGLASRLTEEDLAVLLANPEMMQSAGGMNRVVLSIIVAGLIVAAIIAIAASSNGFIHIG